MNFSIFLFALGVSMVFAETVEQPNSPQTIPDLSQLSPTYTNPGVNPAYTGNQASPTYNGNNPAVPTDVYPNYGYGDFAYGYPHYPVQKSETQESGIVKTLGTILPVLRQAFHVILRIVGKVSLFLLGGAVLLVVGGAFTAAVCAVTPYCTLTFMGYGLSKDQVRSMMTPDRITVATNLVNEAIDKYQKLQGVIDTKNL